MEHELLIVDTVPGEPVSCAAVLKVLADETRLGVIEALLDGQLLVNELQERLQVEPTLLSHHLKALRESGLVETEREGKCIRYRLAESLRRRRRARALDFGCCQITFER